MLERAGRLQARPSWRIRGQQHRPQVRGNLLGLPTVARLLIRDGVSEPVTAPAAHDRFDRRQLERLVGWVARVEVRRDEAIAMPAQEGSGDTESRGRVA